MNFFPREKPVKKISDFLRKHPDSKKGGDIYSKSTLVVN